MNVTAKKTKFFFFSVFILDILYNKGHRWLSEIQGEIRNIKIQFSVYAKYYHLEECFIVEKLKVFECYNITQNTVSLSLLFRSFRYPNAQTYFFVELFNFYQNLSLYEDYLYQSFSQSITTYCLKEMEKRGLISFEKQFKNLSSSPHLRKCMELFGNFQY